MVRSPAMPIAASKAMFVKSSGAKIGAPRIGVSAVQVCELSWPRVLGFGVVCMGWLSLENR